MDARRGCWLLHAAVGELCFDAAVTTKSARMLRLRGSSFDEQSFLSPEFDVQSFLSPQLLNLCCRVVLRTQDLVYVKPGM